MESQKLMAVSEAENWINELQRIEGEVISVSRINSKCLSVRFKNNTRYKLSMIKTTDSCCLDDHSEIIINELLKACEQALRFVDVEESAYDCLKEAIKKATE